MALTRKCQRFVEEYLIDYNGAQAAIRAGYSGRSAKQIASELLTKPDVMAAIDQAKRHVAARAGVTHERIMRELSHLAFTRIDEVCTWDGETLEVKTFDDLTPAQLAAIVEITETRNRAGSTLRVKLSSKQQALESLLKCLQALDLDARVQALEEAIQRNGHPWR